jgi:2-polyprenyl-3-methyl-5-hydroxy-6-metoxy-1,4-benzoquinol methylase
MNVFDYQSIQKETAPCEICDSWDNTMLLETDRYEMGIRTVSCDKCGLIYTNPRPTGKELEFFYTYHYRRFYESIEEPNENYAKSFTQRAEIIYSFIEEYTKSCLSKNPVITVLDIGCGEGSFLKLIKDRFREKVDCYGIEPSIKYAVFARKYSGTEVITGSLILNRDQLRIKKFDLIIANHVLEHFPDPCKQLRTIRCLLKDDGFLFIEVPNILGNWKGIGMFHLAHLFQYDDFTLENLLRKTGFRVVKADKTGNEVHPWAISYICQQSATRSVIYPRKKDIKRKNQVVLKKYGERKNLKRKPFLSSWLLSRFSNQYSR